MNENFNLRAQFSDLDGNSHDLPARNLLMSRIAKVVGAETGYPEIRYEVVFESETQSEASAERFTNIRILVSAKTALAVENLAREALGLPR